MRIEQLILYSLITNDEYVRKVLPFIKEEYFQVEAEKKYYSSIKEFIDEYNVSPSPDALEVIIGNLEAKQDTVDSMKELSSFIEKVTKINKDINDKWMLNQTEKWCKERALFNAINDSIGIINKFDKKDKRDTGAIPEILKNALAISFDSSVGHDYTEDYEKRYDFYTAKETKIPFDISLLNKVTNGGITSKTLNVYIAGTGVGKTLIMCHNAAAYLKLGYNVLYITLEMSEEKIAQRIDANLMNFNINEIETIGKEKYVKAFEKTKKRCPGKLIIKEYPTATANVNHFRHLLSELELKKKFIPDIIIVDYINNCNSSRIKGAAMGDSYTVVKAISEEIRGLAVEFDVPVVSASQFNRTGAAHSDPDMGDIAESFGLNFTCDLILGVVETEELAEMNQFMIKQIKNRYNDKNTFRRFNVGVDKSKMKIYDIDNSYTDEVYKEQTITPFGGGRTLNDKFSGIEF